MPIGRTKDDKALAHLQHSGAKVLVVKNLHYALSLIYYKFHLLKQTHETII